jgi:hypothetical protein
MILSRFLDTDDQRFFPSELRSVIRQSCRAAEPEVRILRPTLPSTIELAAQTGRVVIPETGEVGAAVAPDRVSWTVDPSRPEGANVIARTQLRFTLFHELHHCARGWVFRGGTPRNSFMDYVVSEGLATAFERDAGGRLPPWGVYPSDASAWVAELLRLPVTAPYDQWMFQHPDGRGGSAIGRERTSLTRRSLRPGCRLHNWYSCQLTRSSRWQESMCARAYRLLLRAMSGNETFDIVKIEV